MTLKFRSSCTLFFQAFPCSTTHNWRTGAIGASMVWVHVCVTLHKDGAIAKGRAGGMIEKAREIKRVMLQRTSRLSIPKIDKWQEYGFFGSHWTPITNPCSTSIVPLLTSHTPSPPLQSLPLRRVERGTLWKINTTSSCCATPTSQPNSFSQRETPSWVSQPYFSGLQPPPPLKMYNFPVVNLSPKFHHDLDFW